MIGRDIIEINPPVSEKHKGLYRLSIKDKKTGVIYPYDVTWESLKVILLENKLLKSVPEKVREEYKEAIRLEMREDELY